MVKNGFQHETALHEQVQVQVLEHFPIELNRRAGFGDSQKPPNGRVSQH